MNSQRKLFAISGLIAFVFVAVPSTAYCDDYGLDADSSLTIPIHVNLATIEKKLNDEIPNHLTTIKERNKVCVESEWLKTKVPCVPEVWKTCWLKTKVTPEIKCDIDGWVKRNGQIGFSGKNNEIDISFPIKAKVSAKAGIRETAEAEAKIKARVKPSIDSNWQMKLDVDPDFSWDKRPTLKLFNFIKVTIGSKVEPKIREEMDSKIAEIPNAIAELKLRGRVESAWLEIQKPHKIHDNPNTYFYFVPSSVGFSGFDIEANILKTALSVSGKTHVVVSDISPVVSPLPLPELSEIQNPSASFNINLPLRADFKELNSSIKKSFPSPYIVEVPDGAAKGTLKIKTITATGSSNNKLNLKVTFDYDNRKTLFRKIDIFNWFDTSGDIDFEGVPTIDAKSKIFSIEKLKLKPDTDNVLSNAILRLANLPIVNKKIIDATRYDFTGKIEKAMNSANLEMNRDISPDVRITGTLEDVSAYNLHLDQKAINLRLAASGHVAVLSGL